MSGGGESRFPPTMRLKRRSEFRRVFQDGIVWKGPSFSLHVLPGDTGKCMGIVISRKWGNAVERNRMKRKLREAFRRNATWIPDASIIVKPATRAREASVADLGEALVTAVRQIVRREVPK